MTPAELDRALDAREIPSLLFLFGEETFLLERALRRLRDLTVGEEMRDFNYQVFSGKEIRAEAVLDSVRTLPVFSDHRLVLVKNADLIPAGELETLLAVVQEPVAETVLVFTGEKVDSRRKFFQEFKKKGHLVEFRRLYDNQVPAFVREQARGAGKSFTDDALALFCRRVGSHLLEVHGELSKLFAYMGERNNLVDVGDVAAVVSDTRVDSIFDLTNALGRREAGEALRVLFRLLEEGSAPLLILAMMVRHFRQLWRTREILQEGIPRKEMPRRIGVNPYFLDGLLAQARKFSEFQYRRAFELFLETDLGLKSSGSSPAAILEKLILDLVAIEGPAGG